MECSSATVIGRIKIRILFNDVCEILYGCLISTLFQERTSATIVNNSDMMWLIIIYIRLLPR